MPLAPDSDALIVLLVCGAVIALWRIVRTRHVLVRVLCSLLIFVLAFTTGLAAVNVWFGYYRTWSAVGTDLTGGPAAESVSLPLPGSSAGPLPVVPAVSAAGAGRARLLTVTLPGAQSGIARKGYVWLPPQYGEAAFAHTQLPVLELLHGYPGRPADWLTGLNLTRVLGDEIAAHRLGPMVIVLPTINPASWPGSQECTDAVDGARDATYLGVDVPQDIARSFRVLPPGASWAIGGFSTGGYCAAMLALRAPRSFGAVMDLDGYLHPQEGGFLPRRFHGDVAAESGYDVPTLLAADAHGPLPAFYLMSGSGNRADEADAVTLAHLLDRRESVPLLVEHGAGHTFYAWADALPAALDWVWHQIAPPALQRAVPTVDPAVPGRADVSVPLTPLQRLSALIGNVSVRPRS